LDCKANENYFALKKNETEKYYFSEEWLDKLGYAFVDAGK